MKVIDDLDLYAKLLNSVKVDDKNRPLSPYEVTALIKRMIQENGSRGDVAERLSIKEEMLDEFLILDEIPEEFRYSVVWGTSNDEGVSFSSAIRIARMKLKSDKIILLNAAMNHKFTKSEIENTITLKNRTDMPIEDCIEKVKQFRPVTEHRYMFVLDLSQDLMTTISSIAVSKNTSVDIILKNVINDLISADYIFAILIKNRKVVLSTKKDGYDKIHEILNKNNLSLGQFLKFAISCYRH